MDDDARVPFVVILKDRGAELPPERYIFVFDRDRWAEALEAAWRFVQNTELSFTYEDYKAVYAALPRPVSG